MGLGVLDSLSAPEEHEVFGEELIFVGDGQEGVDTITISVTGDSYRSTTTTTEHEVVAQRVTYSYRSLSHGSGLLRLYDC